MIWMRRCRRWGWAEAALLLLLVGGGPLACGALDVTDPTSILDEDVNDAEGAELLARAALGRFNQWVELMAWENGLLADEFLFQQSAADDQSGSPHFYQQLDLRKPVVPYEYATGASGYDQWQEFRLRDASPALEKLRAYGVPAGRRTRLGELFATRGFATLYLAERTCPGFPLHELVNYKLVYGPPLSTAQAFERALTELDSAVTWAADSARVLNLARVGRARALLNLGRFAEAGAAAHDVPTGYRYETAYDPSTASFGGNRLSAVLGFPWNWGVERGVADREGGNGLNYVSAQDPRVPTTQLGTARDNTTPLYGTTKYPTRTTPIVVAGGIEARLIEAEAALRANPDDLQWLTILNELRRNWVTPALADTTDPGTAAARVDLLFRERAFWLFGTGSRLGDLRRLMRQYGRSRESVFPAGAYWRGGSYGAATSFSFSEREKVFSPGVTGCTGE